MPTGLEGMLRFMQARRAQNVNAMLRQQYLQANQARLMDYQMLQRQKLQQQAQKAQEAAQTKAQEDYLTMQAVMQMPLESIPPELRPFYDLVLKNPNVANTHAFIQTYKSRTTARPTEEQLEERAFEKAHPGAGPLEYREWRANLARSGGKTLVQKFLDTPIGALSQRELIRRDGRPFENPAMTVGEALKAGGVLLTAKSATDFRNTLSAESNLDILQNAGSVVLPHDVPETPGATVRDIYLNPLKRHFLAMTDPRYAGYEHTKAGIIPYMRTLTRVGRINQQELNLVVERLNNAQTYPALVSAVEAAKEILRKARVSMISAGRLNPVTSP